MDRKVNAPEPVSSQSGVIPRQLEFLGSQRGRLVPKRERKGKLAHIVPIRACTKVSACSTGNANNWQKFFVHSAVASACSSTCVPDLAHFRFIAHSRCVLRSYPCAVNRSWLSPKSSNKLTKNRVSLLRAPFDVFADCGKRGPNIHEFLPHAKLLQPPFIFVAYLDRLHYLRTFAVGYHTRKYRVARQIPALLAKQFLYKLCPSQVPKGT
jgi:hypothetical protein